jgi:hypothetical protein
MSYINIANNNYNNNNNFIGNRFQKKCKALLCNHYCFDIKGARKGIFQNLSLFRFHPIWTKCSTLWHIGGPLQIFIYFILERDLEGCPNFKGRLFIFLMVDNATFKNISVILWPSVILVEETERPGDNHRPVASHWQFLSHNVLHQALIEIRNHNISGDRYWLYM